MLTKTKKKEIISDLTEKFKKSKFAIFVDPTGLDSLETNALRNNLRAEQVSYKFCKKNLLKIALNQAGLETNWLENYPGSVAVAFTDDVDKNIAKNIWQFVKKNQKPKIITGWVKGKFINEKEVLTIAKLPTKEILQAQVVGGLANLFRSLNWVLKANLNNLVLVLSQIKNKVKVNN